MWSIAPPQNHFGICQPTPDEGQIDFLNSPGVCSLAFVETQCLLIDIPEHLPRYHAHIRSTDGLLQETPEVLHAVGVHVSTNRLASGVNCLVDELRCRDSYDWWASKSDHPTSLNCTNGLPISSGNATVFGRASQNRKEHGAITCQTSFAPGRPCSTVNDFRVMSGASGLSTNGTTR